MANMKAVLVDLAIDKSTIVPSSKAPALTVDNFALSLKCIPYIHHPLQFKKDQIEIQALLDSGIKVNTMTLAYVAKLGLKVRLTNI